MKGIQICLGHTLLTDAQGGGKQIGGLTGHMIGGLDSMQATVVQNLLINEFGDDFNAFLKPILIRLAELGFVAEVNNGADPAEVEKNMGMLKKEEKTDKNAR